MFSVSNSFLFLTQQDCFQTFFINGLYNSVNAIYAYLGWRIYLYIFSQGEKTHDIYLVTDTEPNLDGVEMCKIMKCAYIEHL